MRKQFIVYYISAVKQQLESGKPLEDVDVDFLLTVIKPLQAQWLVDMFNFFTTQKGADKGWKIAGIVGILNGTIVLPSENPCEPFFLNPLSLWHCLLSHSLSHSFQ